MAQPIIHLQDVRKSFRAADGTQRPVLEGVDFTLHDGEIVALLGQSGSGKSTMLRIMAGLIRADAGEVRLRDQQSHRAGPALFGVLPLGGDTALLCQAAILFGSTYAQHGDMFSFRAQLAF